MVKQERAKGCTGRSASLGQKPCDEAGVPSSCDQKNAWSWAFSATH